MLRAVSLCVSVVLLLSLAACSFGERPEDVRDYLTDKYGGTWTSFHEPVMSLRRGETTYFFENATENKQVHVVEKNNSFKDDYDRCDTKSSIRDTLVGSFRVKAVESFVDVKEAETTYTQGVDSYNANIVIKNPSFDVTSDMFDLCLTPLSVNASVKAYAFVFTKDDYDNCMAKYEKYMTLDSRLLNKYKALCVFELQYENGMWSVSQCS